MLVEGRWVSADAIPSADDGVFERSDARFRSWVTADGSAGPSGEGGFGAEAGRYHLYAYVGCPWAHRTLIYRQLKRLDQLISLSLIATMGGEGWVFGERTPYLDTEQGARHLHEIYCAADPSYTGRVTVPVLWDKKLRTIVNNESSEIIRMFNSAFDALLPAERAGVDYYPDALRDEIDTLNALVYANVNNGVYRAGFARTQAAYDAAIDDLFAALGQLEQRLEGRRFLLGERLTEADWRLFPTLIRFDVAYHSAFSCNVRRIVDYPNLWRWTRELYNVPGIAQTVDLDLYRVGYHSIPGVGVGIVPRGPQLDLSPAR